MSLWGTSSSDRSKPKFLVAGGTYSPDDCYATDSGWVLRHKDGTEELLVCVSGLATALGAAQIDTVFFEAASYASGGVAKVHVSWTEAVTLTSGTPTLSVTTVSGLAGSPVSFSYLSGTGTNEWIFSATLSNAALPGETLAIAGQAFGGGASIAGSADTTFVNGDRVGSQDVGGAYANIRVTGATILKVAFTAATLSQAADTVSCKIKFNTAVTVTGVPTFVVSQTVSGAITLTYASGSGTDTLIFTKTTAGLVSTRTVSIAGQTLGMTSATALGFGSVAADVIFVNGDRTDSAFSGAYADIVVGA